MLVYGLWSISAHFYALELHSKHSQKREEKPGRFKAISSDWFLSSPFDSFAQWLLCAKAQRKLLWIKPKDRFSSGYNPIYTESPIYTVKAHWWQAPRRNNKARGCWQRRRGQGSDLCTEKGRNKGIGHSNIQWDSKSEARRWQQAWQAHRTELKRRKCCGRQMAGSKHCGPLLSSRPLESVLGMVGATRAVLSCTQPLPTCHV